MSCAKLSSRAAPSSRRGASLGRLRVADASLPIGRVEPYIGASLLWGEVIVVLQILQETFESAVLLRKRPFNLRNDLGMPLGSVVAVGRAFEWYLNGYKVIL